VAFLRFEDAVQEVFAVQVLPGLRYPELAPEDPKLLADSYDLPSAALEDVPAALRRVGPAQPPEKNAEAADETVAGVAGEPDSEIGKKEHGTKNKD
jgi:hypothetical protein